MADNSTQSGADTIATDDVTTLNGNASSGVKVQRVKVQYGDDNTARDVSKSFPLPVGNFAQTSGTFTASDAVVAAPIGDGTLVSGTSTAGSVIALAVPDGLSAWTMLVKSFGTGFIYSEASANSTNGTDGDWVEVKGRRTGTAPGVESVAYAYSSNGYYRGNDAGFTWLRGRFIGTGTPTLQITGSTGTGAVFLNSGIPAGSSTIGSVTLSGSGGLTTTSGAITATTTNTPGSAVTASTTAQVVSSVATAGNATFHIVATAFVGTLIFEASVDGGLNYSPVIGIREDGTGAESSAAISTAAAFIRQYTVALPGMAYFRVRCSAFTSGSAAVLIAPGPFLIEPNPSLAASTASIGTVAVNPASGTTVTPVGGVAAAQTPPASGGTGTVCLTLTAVTAAASLIAAPGAGLSIYVTDMEGSNSGATGTLVSLFEGTTNLRYARFMAASGGGFVTNLRTPWKLPANTAVGYANSAASTSIYLTCSYFVAP